MFCQTKQKPAGVLNLSSDADECQTRPRPGRWAAHGCLLFLNMHRIMFHENALSLNAYLHVFYVVCCHWQQWVVVMVVEHRDSLVFDQICRQTIAIITLGHLQGHQQSVHTTCSMQGLLCRILCISHHKKNLKWWLTCVKYCR